MATERRSARIQDVAQRAGVSWKTVSNVLHDHPHVRAETRARVQAAIAELDYRPSLAGRQLRRGRTELLALAVPEISSPYFGALAHALIEAAGPAGYTVLIDETHGRLADEQVVAGGFAVRLIDGIVFSPLDMTGAQIRERRDRTPMVLLGEHVTSQESGHDHVTIDNVASAREATTHLLERGRRRIAFLGYQPAGPRGTGDLRLQGYREALAAAGLPADPALVLAAESYTRAQGEAEGRALIARPPGGVPVDAVVCANDLLAVGLLAALRRGGVDVPREVAVLGWDDAPEGAYVTPSLTTVAGDRAQLARTALDALLARIDGDESDARTYVVPHRLVVRESTGGGA